MVELLSADGFPSTKTVTFEFPLMLRFPSISTVTEGIDCITSMAFPPVLTKALSTLIIFLSNEYSTACFFSVTSNVCKVVVPASNDIASNILFGSFGVIKTWSMFTDLCPKRVTVI